MTTATEPSVAELVVKLKDRLRADTQFGGNKDYPIANSELRQIVRALEGLERRCAEMEKALRAARAWIVSGKDDDYFQWIRRRNEALEAVTAALYDSGSLPPERANEGERNATK